MRAISEDGPDDTLSMDTAQYGHSLPFYLYHLSDFNPISLAMACNMAYLSGTTLRGEPRVHTLARR